MAVPLWISTSSTLLAAKTPLLFSHGTSINIYVSQVTIPFTILLYRMATHGLDDHTFCWNRPAKLLYQSVLFKNSGSAWLLEVLFNIFVNDLDKDSIQEEA